MKVVAFNGSASKEGNTFILLNVVLDELKSEGIETELISLAGKPIQGCIACYQCTKNKNRRCAVEKDILNDCLPFIQTYRTLCFAPTPEMKAVFIDVRHLSTPG